jgi:hypothetical protein
MSSEDALISSWPILVWQGHRPQEGGGCVLPSNTRATKVPWHHSPGEPTGVGEGPRATESRFRGRTELQLLPAGYNRHSDSGKCTVQEA